MEKKTHLISPNDLDSDGLRIAARPLLDEVNPLVAHDVQVRRQNLQVPVEVQHLLHEQPELRRAKRVAKGVL